MRDRSAGPRGRPGGRRRRRGPRAALAALLGLLLAAPAAAAPPAGGAARVVDPSAVFHLALQPRALHADAPLFRAAIRTWPEAAALLDELRATLGLDLLDPRDFAATGLDPRADVLLSAFSVERTAIETAYRAATHALAARDWRALGRLPPAFYRHRVVARVADPLRLGAFLADQDRKRLKAVTPAAVAALLRLDRRPAARLSATLRTGGAVALGRLPGDGFVLVRLEHGETLVVDLVQPWLGAAPPVAEAARLLRRLCARRAADGLGALPHRGAWRLFTPTAAVALHVAPARLQELVTINLREQALVALPRVAPELRPRRLHEVEAAVRRCRAGLARAAAVATLEDAAVSLGAAAGALEVRFGFTLAAERDDAFVARDDHLANLAAVAQQSLAVLGLRLDLARFLGRTARPGPFAGSVADLERFVATCGPLSELLVATQLWPEALALVLDEARRAPAAGAVVAGLHNLVVALHDLAAGTPRVFAFASLDPAAATSLERLARVGRTPVLMRRDAPRPGRTLAIAASDAELLAHARALGSRRASLSPRAPGLEAYADLGRLLRARVGPSLATATLRPLAGRLGRAHAELAAEGDVLIGTLRLELR